MVAPGSIGRAVRADTRARVEVTEAPCVVSSLAAPTQTECEGKK